MVAPSVTHTFVSPVVDAGDPTLVGPDEWNGGHTVAGLQRSDEKGAASGYAPLDSGILVPIAYLPTGTSGTTVALGNHSHGSPAHASTHSAGGADPEKLDDLATPDDNTDLNASTARHGLMRKFPGDTTTFLRADGNFSGVSALPSSLPTMIGCRAQHFSAGSIFNIPSSPTLISWTGSDVYDTDSMHDPAGAHPERITINTSGYYRVTCHVEYFATPAGWTTFYVLRNAGNTNTGAPDFTPVGDNSDGGGYSNGPRRVEFSFVFYYDVADYITVQIGNNSGSGVFAYESYTWFEAYRIGA